MQDLYHQQYEPQKELYHGAYGWSIKAESQTSKDNSCYLKGSRTATSKTNRLGSRAASL